MLEHRRMHGKSLSRHKLPRLGYMPNKGLRGTQGVRRGDQKGDHPLPVDVLKMLAGGTCPDHPRYAKKRKPTSTCENCWFLWFLRGITSKDFDFQLV